MTFGEIKAAVVLLALLSLFGWYEWTEYQLTAAEGRATQAAEATHAAEYRAQQAQVTASAALAGQGAIATYAENVDHLQPSVDRAAARIVRDCAGPSATTRVPAAAGVPDAAAGGAEDRGTAVSDAERQAFAADLSSDLKTCTAELERFRALQSWAEAVSTVPSPSSAR